MAALSRGADCLRISRAITQLNPCRFLITLRECATVVSLAAGSVPFLLSRYHTRVPKQSDRAYVHYATPT
jgi:hypothetical protein